jgi:hypothetical protein
MASSARAHGHVYLFWSEPLKLHKIGYSRQGVESRLGELNQQIKGANWVAKAAIRTADPEGLERLFHAAFSSSRSTLEREWFCLTPEQEMLFIALARGHADAYDRGKKAGSELAGRAGDVVVTPGRRFIPGFDGQLGYVLPQGEELPPEHKADILAALREEANQPFSAAIYEAARMFHDGPTLGDDDVLRPHVITVIFPDEPEHYYQQGRTARHLAALDKAIWATRSLSPPYIDELELVVGVEAPEVLLATGDMEPGSCIYASKDTVRSLGRELGFLE